MSNVWDTEDAWGDTDPFKLQNELAQTMQSIHLGRAETSNDEDDDEDNDDNNDDGIDDQVVRRGGDHVHYEDETYNESSNPFLANENDDNENNRDRINIGMLKEKKNQLLQKLTSESEDKSFMKADRVENVDELLDGSSDTKVGKLMSLTSPVLQDDSKSSSDAVERLQSRIISPTRKVKLLRPRRVKASSDSVSDPLSAPLSTGNDSRVKEMNGVSSPITTRQKLISESEAPLFNIKREDVLGNDKSNDNEDVDKTDADEEIEILKEEKAEEFEINVGDPLKVGELTNAHVVYTITTKTSSDILEYHDVTVTRRYSDFLWLYSQLLNNHPGYVIPPPPEKQVYGRFDDKFIENRRLALENMLQKVCNRKVFQNDKSLLVFLQSNNFPVDSKNVENEINAKRDEISTVTQLLNINSNLGINESNNGGGFFGSLIGLNTSKYVEEDPFILGKQEYITSLDQQLRHLSQSLDMILEKREELSSSLNDVTVVIQQLADLEINPDITEILVNFEELQTKVKELLDNRNLSQMLTFGSTIDEYTRIIGSVRNCFENRLKICNSITILKQHKDKKEHSLVKASMTSASRVDKVSSLEAEVKEYRSNYDLQCTFKQKFDTILKSELQKFEVGKITDFKNMIEIYWESLIENQKLLIELWETFYEKCNFE